MPGCITESLRLIGGPADGTKESLPFGIGLSADGSEYVIAVRGDRQVALPYLNCWLEDDSVTDRLAYANELCARWRLLVYRHDATRSRWWHWQSRFVFAGVHAPAVIDGERGITVVVGPLVGDGTGLGQIGPATRSLWDAELASAVARATRLGAIASGLRAGPLADRVAELVDCDTAMAEATRLAGVGTQLCPHGLGDDEVTRTRAEAVLGRMRTIGSSLDNAIGALVDLHLAVSDTLEPGYDADDGLAALEAALRDLHPKALVA